MDYKYRVLICIGLVLISLAIINGSHEKGSITSLFVLFIGVGSIFHGLGGFTKTKG
jgi:uncharacterized membrane protein